MNWKIPAASAVLALALVACAEEVPVAPEDRATTPLQASTIFDVPVYVIHGINGSDLGLSAALPVDVSVNGACAIPGFTFRQIVGPLALEPGEYTIAVSLANPSDPCSESPVIGPATIELKPADQVSIVAHLTEGGAPTASVFEDSRTASIIARHAAAFTPVDVKIMPSTPFSSAPITVEDLANGSQAAAPLRAGEYRVEILPANTGTVVYQETFVTVPSETMIRIAVGTPANGTFEVLSYAIEVPDRLLF